MTRWTTQSGGLPPLRWVLFLVLILSLLWTLFWVVRFETPSLELLPPPTSQKGDSSTESFSTRIPPACQGDKEPVYRLLVDAGVGNVSNLCSKLPAASQIHQLYGDNEDSPVIIGLERCEAYRRRLNKTAPNLRVAGLYNTGTNALARLIHAHFYPRESYNETVDRFNVPWGKHMDLSVLKRNNRTVDLDSYPSLLPVVVIKEPYYWMQSMCQTRYDARWKRLYGRCPNLIPLPKERRAFPFLESFPVTVTYINTTSEYPSLVHWWSSYYRSYLDWEVPRLVIRYSDVLFHAQAVFQSIADCAGLPLEEFQFYVDPAKDHGNARNGFVQAVIKYGGGQNRTKRMTVDDLTFAREHLDSTLTKLFHYQVA